MIVAIVQARVGSTRFPRKVLTDISGATMLERVVERVREARSVERVVVATTTATDDDAVEQLCRRIGVACFRGSEEDVLDRYHAAAHEHGASIVVRITSDCPLLDPALIDTVVDQVAGGCDYAANVVRTTYPDGLDVEAMTVAALDRAWREAVRPHEREHVTPYLRDGGFRVGSVEETGRRDLGRLRWTVDEPEDLEFVRSVYERIPAGSTSFEDVLALLEENANKAAEIGRASCRERV